MLLKFKKYLIAGSLIFHFVNFIKSLPSRLKSLAAKFKAMAEELRRKCDYAIGFTARNIVYRFGSIQKNKIFFMTFDSAYTCNPRYITEEILRQQLPVDLVWVVPAKGKVNKAQFPPGIRLVRRGSYSMYEEMSSAKIWIDNALNCVWYGMPKKKGQIYINTWHGSMGIKQLHGNRNWTRKAQRCNRLTDYCVSNSSFEEQVYRETFWPDVPCLKFGHARNDILFDTQAYDSLRQKLCQRYKLMPDQKFFLYAPTFRDSGETDFKSVDYERLKNALELRFGGTWVILVRLHFKDRKRKPKIPSRQWLKNVSGYEDMQELLAVVDAGMTDYSSWAYDYILTRRPLFLYVPDLEAYDQERGFYYPLESTPFPIAKNNEELEAQITAFDEAAYHLNTERFLQEKGCYETGEASRRIVTQLKELMELESDPETPAPV